MKSDKDLSESLDLSFLSAEEELVIQQVLQRDEKLRRQETGRIRRLRLNIPDPKQLKVLTGDWFQELKVHRFGRHTNVTDVVKNSMRRRKAPAPRSNPFADHGQANSEEEEKGKSEPTDTSVTQISKTSLINPAFREKNAQDHESETALHIEATPMDNPERNLPLSKSPEEKPSWEMSLRPTLSLNKEQPYFKTHNTENQPPGVKVKPSPEKERKSSQVKSTSEFSVQLSPIQPGYTQMSPAHRTTQSTPSQLSPTEPSDLGLLNEGSKSPDASTYLEFSRELASPSEFQEEAFPEKSGREMPLGEEALGKPPVKSSRLRPNRKEDEVPLGEASEKDEEILASGNTPPGSEDRSEIVDCDDKFEEPEQSVKSPVSSVVKDPPQDKMEAVVVVNKYAHVNIPHVTEESKASLRESPAFELPKKPARRRAGERDHPGLQREASDDDRHPRTELASSERPAEPFQHTPHGTLEEANAPGQHVNVINLFALEEGRQDREPSPSPPDEGSPPVTSSRMKPRATTDETTPQDQTEATSRRADAGEANTLASSLRTSRLRDVRLQEGPTPSARSVRLIRSDTDPDREESAVVGVAIDHNVPTRLGNRAEEGETRVSQHVGHTFPTQHGRETEEQTPVTAQVEREKPDRETTDRLPFFSGTGDMKRPSEGQVMEAKMTSDVDLSPREPMTAAPEDLSRQKASRGGGKSEIPTIVVISSEPTDSGEREGRKHREGVSGDPSNGATPSAGEVWEDEDLDSDDERSSVSSFGSDLSGQRGQGSGGLSVSGLSTSMMSVYSDAGDFGNLAVQGAVEFALKYSKGSEFIVLVGQCQDLAVANARKQRTDPYVKTYLYPDKSSKKKTSVKKRTVNPVYGESLKYKIKKEDLQGRTLNLSVWHNDATGRNVFLGQVEMDLRSWDWGHEALTWYNLEPKNPEGQESQETNGVLTLALQYTTPGSTGETKPNSGEIHIWLKEAKELRRLKPQGVDSFVKCYMLPDTSKKSRQKTRVLKKSQDPVYNHTMVYDGFRAGELREACCELTVWDHNTLSNQFLGGARLSLGTGESYGKKVTWMDSRHEEVQLWEKMLAFPNTWVEGSIPLRSSMTPRK